MYVLYSNNAHTEKNMVTISFKASLEIWNKLNQRSETYVQ